MVSQGVYYIGVGISGGYQATGRRPSMSPGGQDAALDLMMPFYQKVAAKDSKGDSCVGWIGQGGAGHYVKMMHNGIEHTMMPFISELWEIMNKHLGMSYEDIGAIFEKWFLSKELKNTFLVKIGADICRKWDNTGHHVLGDIQDKVVQYIDGSEGTGIWSNVEATSLHVPDPTLSAAHYLRIASANRVQWEHVKSNFHSSFLSEKLNLTNQERNEFLEDLRWAVYTTCLSSFVQGMEIIDVADRKNKWGIDYNTVIQVWRAGCIIQANHIADPLSSIFAGSHRLDNDGNLLYETVIVQELKTEFPKLKNIVLKGIEINAIIPSMSATLEYLKYCGNLDLLTQFYEAELDYFGKHMFDRKGELAGKPETGKHHFEWKPA